MTEQRLAPLSPGRTTQRFMYWQKISGPKFGAAREIRTPDPIITNDVLYQLSYCGPADQRRAGGAFRTAPLSMPVFPLLAIRPNAVARAASR